MFYAFSALLPIILMPFAFILFARFYLKFIYILARYRIMIICMDFKAIYNCDTDMLKF